MTIVALSAGLCTAAVVESARKIGTVYTALPGEIKQAPDGTLWMTNSSRRSFAIGGIFWRTELVRLSGSNQVIVDAFTGVPCGVAVDRQGNAVMCGPNFLRKYSRTGQMLWQKETEVAPQSVTVDADGAIYITGKQNDDAFIAKYSGDGSGPIYLTKFGGSGAEEGVAIAVDRMGAVWIAGNTLSPDLPVTNSAMQPTYGGGVVFSHTSYGDAFAAKVAPDGKSVLYATYLGGKDSDLAHSIAVDSRGRVIITGLTLSTDFPIGPNAFQTTYRSRPRVEPGEAGNAFLIFLDNRGERLWSTYFGGAERFTAGDAVFPQSNRVAVAVSGTIAATLEGRSSRLCDESGGFVVFDTETGRPTTWFGSYGLTDVSLTAGNSAEIVLAGAVHKKPFFGELAQFGQAAEYGLDDVITATVNIDAPAPDVAPACIVNAASLTPTSDAAVAAGEIITIAGQNLGPEIPVIASPNSEGRYPSEVEGVRVEFGGVPAMLLYASSTQINAVVPNALSSQTVKVVRGGKSSGLGSVNIRRAVPGLFLSGLAPNHLTALNEDGTVNSEANPALPGSVITLFGTGFGGVDTLLQSSIGQILNAGQARGMPPGTQRLEIRLPGTVPVGTIPIKLSLDQLTSTQDGVFIFVGVR